MLTNENIICISSIDWDFVWQGHQEIMSAFARNGNRVLFIENTGVRTPRFKDLPRLRKRIANWLNSVKGFREVERNVYVYAPLILPFPYSGVARSINKHMLLNALNRWMRVMDFHDPIVWTFLPTGIALDIADNVEKKLLVYYCIADFRALSDNPVKVQKTEDELIERCDLIFAQGELLKKRCLRFNGNVHIFPFGVNMDAFNVSSASFGDTPDDIKGIKRPIVGYVGGLHRHMDFGLIKFIAERHPEWSVVLIGPEQADTAAITGIKNVFLLGKKEFIKLPGYINGFDVGIIPYILNDYTESVFPTKLNEYHAMGKPVVSTELPEILKYNKENGGLVFTANTYEGFVDRISDAMRERGHDAVSRRIESASRNSWNSRIEEMSALIGDTIMRKKLASIEWRSKLLNVYRKAQKKAVFIALLAVLLYVSIFCTPLIWNMASPLSISDPPEKADCIVVFAGGVGESGKAGQGFEERTEHAIELYKQGYAKNILFSSGYKYAFKEPEVMRALAISVGVPPGSILLEDNATNTYQNVKFSSELLRDKNMKTAIVVSSRYNMRRIMLVAKKIAPDIRFIYSPIEKSLFFGNGKIVQFKHISAIMHEYVGIIYYWFKGYI